MVVYFERAHYPLYAPTPSVQVAAWFSRQGSGPIVLIVLRIKRSCGPYFEFFMLFKLRVVSLRWPTATACHLKHTKVVENS